MNEFIIIYYITERIELKISQQLAHQLLSSFYVYMHNFGLAEIFKYWLTSFQQDTIICMSYIMEILKSSILLTI